MIDAPTRAEQLKQDLILSQDEDDDNTFFNKQVVGALSVTKESDKLTVVQRSESKMKGSSGAPQQF